MASATRTREVVGVSLPLPLAAALREYARNDDRTISGAGRKLIAQGLGYKNGDDGPSPEAAAAKTPSGVAQGET